MGKDKKKKRKSEINCWSFYFDLIFLWTVAKYMRKIFCISQKVTGDSLSILMLFSVLRYRFSSEKNYCCCCRCSFFSFLFKSYRHIFIRSIDSRIKKKKRSKILMVFFIQFLFFLGWIWWNEQRFMFLSLLFLSFESYVHCNDHFIWLPVSWFLPFFSERGVGNCGGDLEMPPTALSVLLLQFYWKFLFKIKKDVIMQIKFRSSKHLNHRRHCSVSMLICFCQLLTSFDSQPETLNFSS